MTPGEGAPAIVLVVVRGRAAALLRRYRVMYVADAVHDDPPEDSHG